MKAVSIDDFFKINLVNNLAELLGIDKSLIRVVNIVSADRNSRRRRRSPSDVSVEIEIADPPLASNVSSSSNYTGMKRRVISVLSFILLSVNLLYKNHFFCIG